MNDNPCEMTLEKLLKICNEMEELKTKHIATQARFLATSTLRGIPVIVNDLLQPDAIVYVVGRKVHEEIKRLYHKQSNVGVMGIERGKENNDDNG